ncbi:hypothetical protein [Photorhabdus africana]|uniref:hypothetical protein n=1 Tax=Photorhabdus africana TaxID=3097554 RepID=UPI002B40C8EC|nr:hypothetical protein [Photorhabdus sp. CRI-LC]
MKSILNLTYPATFKFSFTKVEIKDGKAFMNTYGIKQTFEVKGERKKMWGMDSMKAG